MNKTVTGSEPDVSKHLYAPKLIRPESEEPVKHIATRTKFLLEDDGWCPLLSRLVLNQQSMPITFGNPIAQSLDHNSSADTAQSLGIFLGFAPTTMGWNPCLQSEALAQDGLQSSRAFGAGFMFQNSFDEAIRTDQR